MTELYDYERFGVPREKGGRYFYSRNNGLQNQSVLYVRDSPRRRGPRADRSERLVSDGATALAEWTPSEDGKLLVYAIQDGGTDWRTVQGARRRHRPDSADEVKWVKFAASNGPRTAAASIIPASRSRRRARPTSH